MNVTPPRKKARTMTYNNERRMGAKYKREEHANEARYERWLREASAHRDPSETNIFETKMLLDPSRMHMRMPAHASIQNAPHTPYKWNRYARDPKHTRKNRSGPRPASFFEQNTYWNNAAKEAAAEPNRNIRKGGKRSTRRGKHAKKG
jgi:hypothetical protein